MIIKDVSKFYGKHCVLNKVNFEIKEGNICGLFGLNGAGKSTLMKIICSIIKPDEGKVILLKNKKVGFMIEQPSFFPNISGFQNIKLLAILYENINEERINEVLKIVGLTKQKNELYKNYSLGMKQRLYFAYALLNDPSYLILDEPFNGIDPITVKLFKDIIRNLSNEGRIIIISSHGISELQDLCTQAIIIDQGKVLKNIIEVKDINLTDLFLNTVKSDGEAQ